MGLGQRLVRRPGGVSLYRSAGTATADGQTSGKPQQGDFPRQIQAG